MKYNKNSLRIHETDNSLLGKKSFDIGNQFVPNYHFRRSIGERVNQHALIATSQYTVHANCRRSRIKNVSSRSNFLGIIP